MRKISLLVLCFIVFSLLLTLPAGCHAKTSTILFSTWNHGEALPRLDLEAGTQITQYIYDCSVASGYTSYNWAGSETTQDHIFDAAAGVNHTYSITFFIGHGGAGLDWNGIVPEWQYWIYDSDGNRVYDREIYPYSACQNVKFVFLWSCKQGNDIGGKHWFSGTHYGMPYGWVHTTDLSEDGYASPDNNGYCFIGIDGDSPSLLRSFDGRYAAFYYFIGHFYAAALCGDKTINEALDYASQEVWNVNFGESILYNGFEWETPEGETCSGQMVVFGDGNLNVGKSATAPTLPAPPPDRVLTISASSGGTTDPEPGTYTHDHGSTVTVKATETSGYYYFNHWRLDVTEVYDNPITVTMDSDHTLRAYFTYVGGDWGGCPILSVFDGSNYVTEGLLDIHNPDGVDLVYNHTLITEPAWTTGAYQLRLTEHPQTHSYIDQVKLYATLEDGTEIELPLICAWHSEDGNVLPQLLFSDEWKTETLGADRNNGTSQSIDLRFSALPRNLSVVSFVFQIEGNNACYKW